MKEEREKRRNSRPPSRLFQTTDQDAFNDTLDENLSIPTADNKSSVDDEKGILDLDEDLAILTPDNKSSVDDNVNKEIHDQSLQFVNENVR